MNDLGEIESHIEDVYYGIIENYNKVNTGLRIDTYHVSDFTSLCLRKSYYTRTQPRPPFDRIRAKILWEGNIVHEHAILSPINELTMCYDIVKDVSVQPIVVSHMSKEEKKNIITGTLDDLMHYNGEYIIADKKTWNARGWKKDTPDTGYVLQLEIYRVLLKESYGIDATSGCLLYLDKSDDLHPKPMAFRLGEVSSTKKFLLETLKTLQQEKGPLPNPCWLCNGKNRGNRIFCEYWEKCNEETDRQQQLDMSAKLDEFKDKKAVDKIKETIKATKKLEDFVTP